MEAIQKTVERQASTGIRVEGEVLFLVNGDCHVTRNQLATITNKSWRTIRYYQEDKELITPISASGKKVEYSLQVALRAMGMETLADQIKQKRILRLPPTEAMRKRKKVSNVVQLQSLGLT